MKTDYVGWYTDWLNPPGNKTKRASIEAMRMSRRSEPNMKTMVPRFAKPWNVWGVGESYAASTQREGESPEKSQMRIAQGMILFRLNARSSEMTETLC